MASQRRHAGMTLTIDHDRATFQGPSVFSTVITKPHGVSVAEWELFWGGSEQSSKIGYREDYTHDGALRAHKEHFDKGDGK